MVQTTQTKKSSQVSSDSLLYWWVTMETNRLLDNWDKSHISKRFPLRDSLTSYESYIVA